MLGKIFYILFYMAIGFLIGAGGIIIYENNLLNSFPTLVVGFITALFAIVSVIISQIWQSKNNDKNIKAQADNLSIQLTNQQKSTDKAIKAQADNLSIQLTNQQESTNKMIKAQEDNLLKQLDSQRKAQLIQLDHEREAIGIKLDHEKEIQRNKTLQEKKEEFLMSLFWCRHYALEQSESEYNYALNKLHLRTKTTPRGNPIDADKLKEISILQSKNVEKHEISIPKFRENYFKVLTLQMQYNFVNQENFEIFKEQQKIFFDSLVNLDKKMLENGDFYFRDYPTIVDVYNATSVKYFNEWSKTIDQLFNSFKPL